MRRKNPVYCRELATRLRGSLGLPENEGRVLASLLVTGGTATLSQLAAVAGTSLGDAEIGRSYLARHGALRRAAPPSRVFPSAEELSGSRHPLARLRKAYRHGGLPAVREEHVRSAESSATYRRVASALERVCPLTPLLHLGAGLEALVCREGFSTAATSLLSRLPHPWQIAVPSQARKTLRHESLLIFGNHASMLTPFLLAAAFERDDLRVLAHRYVATLVPSMAPYILPLEPTYEVSAPNRIFSGPAHLLSLSALRQLDLLVDADEARRTNRDSLQRGVAHVLSGGALAIFPDGGRAGGPWYPGLGRLLLDLQKAQGDVYLVPAREQNCTNRRVYSALRMRRHAGTPRHPIRLVVGEPISTRRFLLPADAEPADVVALLHSLYRSAQWPSVTRWRPTTSS